jgi:DNA-binding MarR family transcriptional regulator
VGLIIVEEDIMAQARSRQSQSPKTLVARVTRLADAPFIDTARAMLKASFMIFEQPGRPHASYDLTLTQLDVLSTLARSEVDGMSCTEIAQHTLITKGGLTGLLDRLEARGLVERSPSREDRRSVVVRLSRKGVDLFGKLYPEQVRFYRSLFEDIFTPAQMKQFGKLLEHLIRGLELPE